MELNERQSRFVTEYVVDLNATQAAVRAGYSPRTAEQQGSRLLRHVQVRAAIDEALARREARVLADADDVLRELARLALVDVTKAFDEEGRLLPLKDIPEDVRRAISGLEVDELYAGNGDGRVQIGFTRKVRFWDKPKSLELLARHLGLIKDRMQVEPGPGWADLVAASMKPKGDAP